MAIRQRKDGRWVVYYRARDGSGKMVEQYFGRGEAAREAAEARNAELNLRPWKSPKRQDGPFFEELAQAYVGAKHFNFNSRKHLKIRLTAHILPYFGGKSVPAMTHQDMTRYVRQRQAEGVKNNTIRRELTDVQAILNWSTRINPPLLPSNPVADFERPPDDDDIIDPPTKAELARIMANASEHLIRAVTIAYYTGLRPGAVEMLSLTWQAVDLEGGLMRIISAQKGGVRRREVPINPAFAAELEKWMEADRECFGDLLHKSPLIHHRKKPIKSIKSAWKATLERAGITRRLRPYDLRHYFVTNALAEGADLKTVSEIVGSSAKTILKYYQHVSNRQRQTVINSIAAIPPPDPELKKKTKRKKTGGGKKKQKGLTIQSMASLTRKREFITR